MRKSPLSRRRPGATIVESAIVLPVTFLLILGLVIGASGIYQYNQVMYLAQETARFAATHGGTYATENAALIKAGTLPSVDANYLITNVAKARAVGVDTSKLKISISINSGPGTYDWDNTTGNNYRSVTSTATQGTSKITVNNMVAVTVSYQWSPQLYFTGPITLTGTWVQPMSY